MLNAIAPGAVSSAANPILDFWTQRAIASGDFTYYAPAAPYTLAFQIWDLRNLDAPVQLFPSSAGTKQPVDLTVDRVAGVVGHYAAAWTCSVAATDKGRYQIRWFYVPTTGAAEQVSARDFDVLPAANSIIEAGTAYALVSDMRDEGVTSTTATDARLLRVLAEASRYIDRVTGRSFAPVYKSVRVTGTGRVLMLGEPVIALTAIDSSGNAIDATSVRVANRHIASNLLSPDDRVNPTIELVSDGWSGGLVSYDSGPAQIFGYTAVGGGIGIGSGFSRQPQAITLTGLFGFTEYDGSPVGRTPLLITKATKLLAFRDIYPIGSAERDDARKRWRLTSESTRDQSYTLADPSSSGQVGSITGDIEIDSILEQFMVGIAIGSA